MLHTDPENTVTLSCELDTFKYSGIRPFVSTFAHVFCCDPTPYKGDNDLCCHSLSRWFLLAHLTPTQRAMMIITIRLVKSVHTDGAK